jgi:hypothetical protein
LASRIAGIASRLGSHAPRQPAIRRKANARISGARISAAAVTPRLELVRVRVPGVVRARCVDPAAVQPEEAVEEAAGSGERQRHRAEAPEEVGAEREPEADREDDHQQAGQVGSDLVVEPSAARGDGAEVGDVVVGGAEGGGLCEVAREPPDRAREEGDQAADAGGAPKAERGHAADLTPAARPNSGQTAVPAGFRRRYE